MSCLHSGGVNHLQLAALWMQALVKLLNRPKCCWTFQMGGLPPSKQQLWPQRTEMSTMWEEDLAVQLYSRQWNEDSSVLPITKACPDRNCMYAKQDMVSKIAKQWTLHYIKILSNVLILCIIMYHIQNIQKKLSFSCKCPHGHQLQPKILCWHQYFQSNWTVGVTCRHLEDTTLA